MRDMIGGGHRFNKEANLKVVLLLDHILKSIFGAVCDIFSGDAPRLQMLAAALEGDFFDLSNLNLAINLEL